MCLFVQPQLMNALKLNTAQDHTLKAMGRIKCQLYNILGFTSAKIIF
jgi:hypothetical protein